MKEPFPRGFPKDLPVRPSTSVNFDWLAVNRNLIDVRVPETLEAKDPGMIVMPIREKLALQWTWHENALKSVLLKPDTVRISARFEPGDNAVHVQLMAENLSQRDWKAVRAVICTRLSSAPDFIGPRTSRTFYWMNGKWEKLPAGFPHIAVDKDPGRAFIAVESVPGRHVVGTGFENVYNVGGNDMPHNLCIHADARLGDIPKGGSAQTRGIIVMTEGTKEDALNLCKSFLSF